jgi:hypothetical protein
MSALKRAFRTGASPMAASFAVILLIVIGAVGLVSTMQPATKPVSQASPTPAVSVTSADGLRLEASVNSTRLEPGQALNVSLSITNTQLWVNTVSTASIWQFEGIPVALWPPCYYVMPVQVVVLEGNFTAAQLSAVANRTSNYRCMEGGTISEVTFQASSDEVRIGGNICVANCNYETLGPYGLEFNFTTTGYWELQTLTSELNPPILGSLTPGSLTSIPFASGVYTIGVADEWGQTAVLHMTVGSPSVSTSQTCVVSSEPTGFFLHVVPDSGVGVIPGFPVRVTPMVECGGSATADTSAEALYVTNGSGWIVASNPPVSGDYYLVYSFEFSGQNYRVTADWRPEQGTFTTVSLPSGNVATEYLIPKSCSFTCTY